MESSLPPADSEACRVCGSSYDVPTDPSKMRGWYEGGYCSRDCQRSRKAEASPEPEEPRRQPVRPSPQMANAVLERVAEQASAPAVGITYTPLATPNRTCRVCSTPFFSEERTICPGCLEGPRTEPRTALASAHAVVMMLGVIMVLGVAAVVGFDLKVPKEVTWLCVGLFLVFAAVGKIIARARREEIDAEWGSFHGGGRQRTLLRIVTEATCVLCLGGAGLAGKLGVLGTSGLAILLAVGAIAGFGLVVGIPRKYA